MKTWQEMAKDQPGTIYADWFEDGIRCLILRGPMALCAYIGLPEGHPLSNNSYEDMPLLVHGGLKFAGKGDDKYLPAGNFWYGWDYSGETDRPFNDIGQKGFLKEWTIEEIKVDVLLEALPDFKKLIKIAETSAAKPK